MSNQDNDSTTQVPSAEITPTRPRQEGKLALLPTEILLQIVNETEMIEKTIKQPPKKVAVCTNILSAQDMKNLALASSSLFHRVRPSFYPADNCYAFRSALEHADLDAMKRCAEFGAAADTHWDLEDECKCKGHKGHLSHRPIDVLLESVKHDSVPISKAIEALQWLLDNGYSAYEQTPHLKDFDPSEVPVGRREEAEAQLSKTLSMPEILILTLDKGTGDRGRTEGVCEMIDMLLHHGCLIPYNLNVYETFRGEDEDAIYTPMNAAVKPQCPPRFLRVLLELYKRHDGHNQRRGDEGDNSLDLETRGCPKSMASWVGWSLVDERLFHFVRRKWRHRPNLGVLAWNHLFAVLDKTQAWKEAYNGEVADILEEKIKLLEEYNFIDDTETQALQGILKGLRSIAAMAESPGGLDRARDGRKCWQLICNPLRPLFFDLGTDYDYSRPKRVHHFEFEDRWNPWVQFYEDEYLQQMGISAEHSYTWIKEGSLWKEEDGKLVDQNFREMTGGTLTYWDQGEERLPWVEYDYDEFLERLSQEWIQNEKEEQARECQRKEATKALSPLPSEDEFMEMDEDSDDDSDVSEYLPDEEEMEEDWD